VALSLRDAVLAVEAFRYKIPGEPDIVWNVTLARLAVARGEVAQPLPVKIAPADMLAIAQANEWDPARIEQADCDRPGIAAPLIMEGRVAYILIDGQHRNARAVREGRSFSAYLLTDEASRACVLEPEPPASHPRLP
jgi:hypothetical protein